MSQVFPPRGPATGTRSARAYAALLHLYPAGFRRRFADSMRFAFAIEADEAADRGVLSFAWFWCRTIAHLLVYGIAERLSSAVRAGTWTPGLRQDFLHAARRLRRSPAFSLATIVTMALGIGATTAIYSVVQGVVLNPLPHPQAERLVAIRHSAPGAGLDLMGVSHGTYVHYREHNEAFDAITVYTPTSFAMLRDGDSLRAPGAMISQDFFEIFLDGPPPLGRAIGDADQQPGAPRVAMISDELWRQHFGADPQVIGRAIQVDGLPAEVVGVLPPDFDVPSTDTQLWLPQQIDPQQVFLGMFGRFGVARLEPGVSVEQAQAELQRLIPTMSERFNPVAFDLIVTSGGLTALVAPLKETLIGDVERMLWILLGTVLFVLGIACANVANLFLVRAESQRRETAVRVALGAGKARIVRHHLAESLVLGLGGGLAGVLLALACVRWVVRWGPDAVPRLHEVGTHPPVLLFAAALSVGTSLLFSLIPILRRGSGTLADRMAEGGRGSTLGSARHRARNTLVVAQMALALILLIGAGLMIRTFQHLRSVEPGFDASSSLTFHIGLPEASYPERERAMQFQQQLIEQLGALPGVVAAGATACLPLDDCDGLTPVYAEGVPFESGAVPPAVDVRGTTAGYFRAMGIPIIEGRAIEPEDHLRRPAAAVVSRNLAERLWPGESAVGKRIHPDVPDEAPYTVVGVVGDVISYGLAEEPPEILYLSFLGPYGYTASPYSLTYVVRSDGPPLALGNSIRATLHELDANVPLAKMRPLQALLNQAAAPTAFAMVLLIVAGGVSLILGAVGVYGVLSYIVSQRTNEIGVRMALGAEAADVGRMIMLQGVAVASIGITIGLAGALALTRLMVAVLFGVDPADPLTFACVAAALSAIALLASWLPARRAARVDPIVALRAD